MNGTRLQGDLSTRRGMGEAYQRALQQTPTIPYQEPTYSPGTRAELEDGTIVVLHDDGQWLPEASHAPAPAPAPAPKPQIAPPQGGPLEPVGENQMITPERQRELEWQAADGDLGKLFMNDLSALWNSTDETGKRNFPDGNGREYFDFLHESSRKAATGLATFPLWALGASTYAVEPPFGISGEDVRNWTEEKNRSIASLFGPPVEQSSNAGVIATEVAPLAAGGIAGARAGAQAAARRFGPKATTTQKATHEVLGATAGEAAMLEPGQTAFVEDLGLVDPSENDTVKRLKATAEALGVNAGLEYLIRGGRALFGGGDDAVAADNAFTETPRLEGPEAPKLLPAPPRQWEGPPNRGDGLYDMPDETPRLLEGPDIFRMPDESTPQQLLEGPHPGQKALPPPSQYNMPDESIPQQLLTAQSRRALPAPDRGLYDMPDGSTPQGAIGDVRQGQQLLEGPDPFRMPDQSTPQQLLGGPQARQALPAPDRGLYDMPNQATPQGMLSGPQTPRALPAPDSIKLPNQEFDPYLRAAQEAGPPPPRSAPEPRPDPEVQRRIKQPGGVNPQADMFGRGRRQFPPKREVPEPRKGQRNLFEDTPVKREATTGRQGDIFKDEKRRELFPADPQQKVEPQAPKPKAKADPEPLAKSLTVKEPRPEPKVEKPSEQSKSGTTESKPEPTPTPEPEIPEAVRNARTNAQYATKGYDKLRTGEIWTAQARKAHKAADDPEVKKLLADQIDEAEAFTSKQREIARKKGESQKKRGAAKEAERIKRLKESRDPSPDGKAKREKKERDAKEAYREGRVLERRASMARKPESIRKRVAEAKQAFARAVDDVGAAEKQYIESALEQLDNRLKQADEMDRAIADGKKADAASSKKKSKGVTLNSNPFLDPAALKQLGPEMANGLVAGMIGHYNETGKIGLDPTWMLYGALGTTAALRIPLKGGKTLFGQNSLAETGRLKAGDLIKKYAPSFHRTGGTNEELYDRLQKARIQLEMTKAEAIEFAKEINDNFTPAQREMMSDWIEQEFRLGGPTDALGGLKKIEKSVRDQADKMAKMMEDHGAKLVKLGALSEKAFKANKGRYLHRYYLDPDGKRGDFWNPHVKKKLEADFAKARGKIRTLHNKSGAMKEGQTVYSVTGHDKKGRLRTIYSNDADRIERLKGQGWKEGFEYEVMWTGDGKAKIRRDWTMLERQEMKEVRDASYRMTRGQIEAAHHEVYAKMFQELAEDSRWASEKDPGNGWVRVSKDTIPGTSSNDFDGIKKFGKLAGMYVHPDVDAALKMVRRAPDPDEMDMIAKAHDKYIKALRAWKVSKTAWNPATHFNNITSNMIMASMTDNIDPESFLKAWRGLFDEKAQKEAQANGLSLGKGLLYDDDMKRMEAELRALVDGGADTRKLITKAYDLFMDNPLTTLYQKEDDFFKLMSYYRNIKKGKKPAEAVKEAHKYFFDYGDLPPGAQKLRDSFMPFIGYSYKVAPALAEIAAKKPHAILATMGTFSALNMYGYGLMFGDGAGDQEDLERELKPDWQKGGFKVPWTDFELMPLDIRMPWNKPDQSRPGEERAVFWNIRNMLPGGMLLDLQNNSEFGPSLWPQVLGSVFGANPFLNFYVSAVALEKDLFFGKEIYPYPDVDILTDEWSWQKGENMLAMVQFASRQFAPGLFYSTNKITDTLVPDSWRTSKIGHVMGWQGTDFAGRELQTWQAVVGALGFKMNEMSLSEGRSFALSKLRAAQRDADYGMYRAGRNKRGSPEMQRQRKRKAASHKRDVAQNRQKETRRLNEMFKNAPRKAKPVTERVPTRTLGKMFSPWGQGWGLNMPSVPKGIVENDPPDA